MDFKTELKRLQTELHNNFINSDEYKEALLNDDNFGAVHYLIDSNTIGKLSSVVDNMLYELYDDADISQEEIDLYNSTHGRKNYIK